MSNLIGQYFVSICKLIRSREDDLSDPDDMKIESGYDFNQTVVEAKIYFFPLWQIQFIFYLNWPKGM